VVQDGPVGRIVDGKYQLLDRIAEGGHSVVYRGLHLGLKKTFAIKLLRAAGAVDPPAMARLEREAQALGRCSHPNIVDVTDCGIDRETGAPYLVMELVSGITLAELCQQQGPLTLERALPILEAIAGAVDAAHECGVLHRDLKPSNVVLSAAQGREPVARVLDFGLAALATGGALAAGGAVAGEPAPAGAAADLAATAPMASRDDLTASGALLGTPLYLAPELIAVPSASPASDIYSFGVIAYQMLVGRPPFEGSLAQVLAGHLHEEPRPPEAAGITLTPQVWGALLEPLRKDPRQRPATARECVGRLRAAGERAALASWSAAEIPRRLRRSAWLAAAMLALGLLLPPGGVPLLERRAYDLRVRAAPARPPDPRILLVTLDEASLGNGAPVLAERAGEIAGNLERILAAGARGVAIDLLLPPQWQGSNAFSDLLLRHPGSLTLAAFSTPDGRVLGTECAAGLTAAALGPLRSGEMFGFVNLDEDADGVARQARLWFRDRAGNPHASWATRAAGALLPHPGLRPGSKTARFWIDHRVDAARFARISYRDVRPALASAPGLFRERLVLLGGDLVAAGDDVHRIPRRANGSGAVSGLALQALLVDTIAAGLPVSEAPRLPLAVAGALFTLLAAAGILCAPRPLAAAVILAAGVLLAGLYVGLSLPLFGGTGLLLPVTTPLVPAMFGMILAAVLRRLLPARPDVGGS
jgi:CHASE2 domain-containing sensor protein/tRNA A-37 threonylcarbamoyl transferase component Bud32